MDRTLISMLADGVHDAMSDPHVKAGVRAAELWLADILAEQPNLEAVLREIVYDVDYASDELLSEARRVEDEGPGGPMLRAFLDGQWVLLDAVREELARM